LGRMPDPGVPEADRDYQITIVTINDSPEPSPMSEMIALIAGARQVCSLNTARAEEMRAHIGKTLSREQFVELLGWSPKLPLKHALALLDDLCAPN